MVDKTKNQIHNPLWENIKIIVFALLLALFIRTFVIQPFKIPSESMVPTLLVGDYIFVSKFIYGVKNPFNGATLIPISTPKANDIIVFQYPRDHSLDYIKRVIAVAGDKVEIREKQIFINDKLFEDIHGEYDPGVDIRAIAPRDTFGPVTVPPHSLFVMGDNRDNSEASRYWGFVDLNEVRGEAWGIYWSWDMRLPLFSPARLQSIRWNRIGSILH